METARKVYVYIGPTVRRLITQNHVFFGDLASVKSELSDQLAKVPSILPLIVPVDDLARARANINIKGTPEYNARKRMIRAIDQINAETKT